MKRYTILAVLLVCAALVMGACSAGGAQTTASATVVPTVTPASTEPENISDDSDYVMFYPDSEQLPTGPMVKLGLVPADTEFSGMLWSNGEYSISGLYDYVLELRIDRMAACANETEMIAMIDNMNGYKSENMTITSDEAYSAMLSYPVYYAKYSTGANEDTTQHKDLLVTTDEWCFHVGTANRMPDEQYDYIIDAWLDNVELIEEFWWPQVSQGAAGDDYYESSYGDPLGDGTQISVTYNITDLNNWMEYEPDAESGAVLALYNEDGGNITVYASYPVDGMNTSEAVAYELMNEISENYVQSELVGPYEWDNGNGMGGMFFRVSAADGNGDAWDEQHYVMMLDDVAFDIVCDTSGEYSDNLVNEFEGIFLDNNFYVEITR